MLWPYSRISSYFLRANEINHALLNNIGRQIHNEITLEIDCANIKILEEGFYK